MDFMRIEALCGIRPRLTRNIIRQLEVYVFLHRKQCWEALIVESVSATTRKGASLVQMRMSHAIATM